MNPHSFSSEWYPDVSMNPAIGTPLLTQSGVAGQDGTIQTNMLALPSYYKGEINEKHVSSTQELHELIVKLDKLTHSLVDDCLDRLSDFMYEYQECKLVSVGLEELLKKEGDRVRLIMAREMELLKKELEKTK
jgi:hypothetical protein